MTLRFGTPNKIRPTKQILLSSNRTPALFPHRIVLKALNPIINRMPVTQHELEAVVQKARMSVITCSDTRTINTDTNGAFMVETINSAGHELISYEITPEDSTLIAKAVLAAKKAGADIILVNGGTGMSKRDNTFDTLTRLIESPLPGYGELFRHLSFIEIGAAAMLSRAQAGRFGNSIIFSMPGSTTAVHLAMKSLIMPQVGHLVREMNK